MRIRHRGLLLHELIGLMLLSLERWNSKQRKPRASRSQKLELELLALQHQEVDRNVVVEEEEEKLCLAVTQKLRWSNPGSKEAKSRLCTKAARQIKKSLSGRGKMAPTVAETRS